MKIDTYDNNNNKSTGILVDCVKKGWQGGCIEIS